jgi:hypothetical protein
MSTHPAPVITTPSAERAHRILRDARTEQLVTREQRRFARQMRAHAAGLLRSARSDGRAAPPRV